MNIQTLAAHLASQPFLKFAKLGTHQREEQAHTLLGFDPFLKNHIGTLHAGAIFAAAQTDAQANLQSELKQHAGIHIAGFKSQIAYKRPAKGPVWMSTTINAIDLANNTASTLTVIHNQNNEPLAELAIEFVLAQEEA